MDAQEAIVYFVDLRRRFEDKPDETHWGAVHNQTTRDAIDAALNALTLVELKEQGRVVDLPGAIHLCHKCAHGYLSGCSWGDKHWERCTTLRRIMWEPRGEKQPPVGEKWVKKGAERTKDFLAPRN